MTPPRASTGEQLAKRTFPGRASPTSSLVPDSQSPEPHTHRAGAQFVTRAYSTPSMRRAPPPARPTSSTGTIVSDSLAGAGNAPGPSLGKIEEEKEQSTSPALRAPGPSAVKLEDQSTFATSSSGSSSSRRTRSRSPSAMDPALKLRPKPDPDIKEEELPVELRRLLYRSRVNEARRQPDRLRERAPSYEQNQVKAEEEEVAILGQTPAARAAVEAGAHETEGLMLPPVARKKPSAAALGKRVVRDYSSSSDDDDDDDGRMSGAGSPETGSSDEGKDEGTPFEDRPPQRKTGILKVKKKKPRTKKPTNTQFDQNASGYLESLNLPAPTFRPVAIKQRLFNQLADTTAMLPAQAHVERVEVPPRPPTPPPAAPRGDDAPVERARSLTPPIRRNAGPSVARPAPADDLLPDYEDDEDGPEQPLALVDDAEFLEEQQYFRRPDKRGAMQRWLVMLGKDKRKLPPVFDYDVFSTDRAFLQRINLALPPAVDSFLLTRDLSSSDFRPLVQSAPSRETCAALWEDLLAPLHPAKHALADALAGRGRGCRCPVWAPDGPRVWPTERERVRSEGLGVEALVEVMRVVFDLDGQEVAAELGEPGRAEELVAIVYEHIGCETLEFARIAHRSRLIASTSLVRGVQYHLGCRRIDYRQEHAAAVARRQEDERRAKAAGSLPRTDLMQDVLLLEGRWAEEEAALSALIDRLEGRLSPREASTMPADGAEAESESSALS